jgi:hypothetical protein
MDLLRHLLFENPLTLCIVLGLAAVGAGFVWSRTGSRRARAVVAVSGGAAVLLILVSALVETDQERVEKSLGRMADAAASGNAEAFIEYISTDYEGGLAGKDSVAAVVRMGLAHLRASVEAPTIRMGDRRACVTQTYRFTPAPGSSVALPPTYDRITWEGALAPDSDGQWRVRSAMAVKPERMTPEEAAQRLRRAMPRF